MKFQECFQIIQVSFEALPRPTYIKSISQDLKGDHNLKIFNDNICFGGSLS